MRVERDETVPAIGGLLLPNRQAARSLDVPYRSLEGLARRVIESNGWRLAPKVVSQRMLRRAAARAGAGADPAGMARAAEGTLRQLLRAGVDLDELEADENPRVGRLAAIGSTYRRLLRQENLIDPAELLWCAAALVSEPELLQLRGFPRLPAAERVFIDSVAGPGSVVHLPLPRDAESSALFAENEGAVRDFEERGWIIEAGEDEARSHGAILSRIFLSGAAESRAHCHYYPDLEAEVRGTLAAVKRLLRSGAAPDRIAIVARDEEAYGPSLMAVAEEYGVPLRVLYQIPLGQSRFGAWVSELARAIVADLPFEATARLLAHPLVDGLDDEMWTRVRSAHTSGWEAWSEQLPMLGGPWPESARRGEYIELLKSLVVGLGAADSALSWAREARAASIFIEELAALPAPGSEVTLENFIAEIEELIRLLTVPAQPGRGGVELHTPLSLFGATVDHLFVVGAAEGVLPSPVRPDPLLDPFEREELRERGYPVEDVASEASREELSFWALLHSAGHSLTLSFPRLLGRSEVLPSPYLARLGVQPAAPTLKPICSPQELRRAALPGDERFDGVLERARLSHSVEARRESEAPYDGHDGQVGVPYLPPLGGLAVTGLVSLASCPFKFFGERVLRLAEPDEAAESLDPSLRGRLFHEVLQLVMEGARGEAAAVEAQEPDGEAGSGYYTLEANEPDGKPEPNEAAAAADPRSAALALLDDAFAAAEEELGLNNLPSWPLERGQHLATLRRAISSEQFIHPEARVRELERSFQADWRGIPVRGRVDRIDDLPDGLELLDYKSGASITNLAKDQNGRSKVDLQLSIYRESAAAALAPGQPLVGSRYFSVTKARDLRAAVPSDEELERIAGETVAAWRNGNYPVDPDIDEHACRYCALDAVCRKGPRLERKRNRL